MKITTAPVNPMRHAAPAAATSVRWKIFFLLLLLTAINYIDRASLSVAMPVIAAEFNLTAVQQGVLLSSFFWTYALMQIPLGLLTDRLRPRVIIGVATILWGLFQASAALASGFVSLLLTRLALGIAESPIFPAGSKLNGIWMTPTERARGATLLDGGAPLGTALGSLLIAGLMAQSGSWRWSFIIAGLGTMLAGVMAYRYIRDEPRDHPSINTLEADYIEAANGELGLQPQRIAGGVAASVGPYLRHPSVLLLFAGWSCYNAVFYGLLTWLPAYLYADRGFDLQTMGGASFLIFFCGFVGELVGGFVTDRWRAAGGGNNRVFRSIFATSALVSMLCLFAVPFTEHRGLLVALLSLALFFIRWCGIFWSLPGLLGAQRVAGALAGAMNFCGNMVGIAVPLLIGAIVSLSRSYFAALLFFAFAAAGLLVCSTRIDYQRRIEV